MIRAAGLGFRSGATLAALREALARAEALSGPASLLATLPAKAADPALAALAAERGLPIRAAKVAGIATPTRSPRIEAMHGTGSVAEAAALAAAGPGARIAVARLSSSDAMATCAIAEAQGPQT